MIFKKPFASTRGTGFNSYGCGDALAEGWFVTPGEEKGRIIELLNRGVPSIFILAAIGGGN